MVKKPHPVAVKFASGLLTVPLLVGCSPLAEEDHYAVAVGSDRDFAGLELRSVFVVTAAEGKPGRLLGTIFNTTGEDVGLVIADTDEEVPVSVPAGGRVEFDSSPTLLQSTEARPGARTDLTLRVRGDTVTLDVAVVDGTLDQYAPYVPR